MVTDLLMLQNFQKYAGPDTVVSRRAVLGISTFFGIFFDLVNAWCLTKTLVCRNRFQNTILDAINAVATYQMLSFLLEDQLQMWVIKNATTYQQKPRWSYGWSVEVLSFSSSLLSSLLKAFTYFAAQYKSAKKLDPGRKRQRIMCRVYLELFYVAVYITLTLIVFVLPEWEYTMQEFFLDLLVLLSILYFFLWVPFYFCTVTAPYYGLKWLFGLSCCCKQFGTEISRLSNIYKQ